MTELCVRSTIALSTVHGLSCSLRETRLDLLSVACEAEGGGGRQKEAEGGAQMSIFTSCFCSGLVHSDLRTCPSGITAALQTHRVLGGPPSPTPTALRSEPTC